MLQLKARLKCCYQHITCFTHTPRFALVPLSLSCVSVCVPVVCVCACTQQGGDKTGTGREKGGGGDGVDDDNIAASLVCLWLLF